MHYKNNPDKTDAKKIKFVLCHHMAERSFHYKDKQFPLCARCTGILIGYFTIPIFHFGIIYPSILVIFLLMVPMIIDSLTQAFGYRESSNVLRFVTGFLGGAAQVALIVLLGKTIVGLLH